MYSLGTGKLKSQVIFKVVRSLLFSVLPALVHTHIRNSFGFILLSRQLTKTAGLGCFAVWYFFFFLCTCLPCLICSFISGVSGAEKVSWSCSWFKKPILWLDRLLHCAAGQGTHNMARGQRETQARPCLEKFGVAYDAKSKGPNLISWWCVTLNMEKSGLVWKMQNKMKHFQCLK